MCVLGVCVWGGEGVLGECVRRKGRERMCMSHLLSFPSSSSIDPGSHSQTLHPAFRPCSEGDPSSGTVVAPCDRPRRPSWIDLTTTSPGMSVCPTVEYCATLDGLLDLHYTGRIEGPFP